MIDEPKTPEQLAEERKLEQEDRDRRAAEAMAAHAAKVNDALYKTKDDLSKLTVDKTTGKVVDKETGVDMTRPQEVKK
jgi:hypothetical protein